VYVPRTGDSGPDKRTQESYEATTHRFGKSLRMATGVAAAAVQELSLRPPKGVVVRVAASGSSAAPSVARVRGGGGGSGGGVGTNVGGVGNAAVSAASLLDDRFTLDMTVDGVPARWELFFAGADAIHPPDWVFVSDPTFAPTDLPSIDAWDEPQVTPTQRLVSAY
jgi:hypothetical protein